MLVLASEIYPKIMFVQDTFLDTLCFNLMLILSEDGRFGDPYKSCGGQDATLYLLNFIRDLFLQNSLPPYAFWTEVALYFASIC